MKIVVPAFPCWVASLSAKLQQYIASQALEFLQHLGYHLKINTTEPRLEGNNYYIEVKCTIVEKEDEGEPGGRQPLTHGTDCQRV